MQAALTAGIDLPLKALVFEDEGGGVFIGYNDPAWIASRHAVTTADAAVTVLAQALQALAFSASH